MHILRHMSVLYCKAIFFKYGCGSTVIPYCLSRSTPLYDSPFAPVSELTSQPPDLSPAGQQCQYISAKCSHWILLVSVPLS